MSYNKNWKEQLGFISGTILVWGTFLLNLWPQAAGFQTGINGHIWTFFWLTEKLNPQWSAYQILTVPLTLAITVLMFSVCHVLARGFWLGLAGTQSNTNVKASQFLNRVADNSYDAVLALWLMAAAMLVLTILQLGNSAFSAVIARYFGVASRWPRVISAMVTFGPVLFVWLRSYKPVMAKLESASNQAKVKIGLLVLFFAMVGMASLEMCYTAALSVDKKLVARSKSEYVEILVTLGGAASDPNSASLQLTDTQSGEARQLTLVPLGEGHYANYVLSSSLAEGHYRIEFSYPHLALSTSYPYLTPRVQHSRPLTVVP